MQVPSPDILLIDAFDALLAPPQRRGVPLPALLAIVGFAPSVGMGLVTLTTRGLASDWLVACWAATTLGFGAYAAHEARGLIREARAWNTSSVRLYRAIGLGSREELAWIRGVFAAFLVGLATAYVVFARELGATAPVPLCIASYACIAGGFLAHQLGCCAMPRDPDLQESSPAPRPA